ncbi:outer membrane protein assembly factor BamB family protein [Nocardia concava]|uniref:outer membrane protein assembly factor BamB family protein n=1 Tax=Nocardia concava TaxID=257281 RepID=UPI0002E288A0|nr:PQQ-binding-like beta-propeller repeat protein [Nocardia concava]
MALINRRKVLRDGAILLATGVASACAAPRAAVETAASGSIAWEHKVDGGVLGLRYGPGAVAVETEAGLTGVDARSGREAWRLPITASGISHRSCVQSGVLTVCGIESDAARVVSVDMASGERKWSFDAPEGVTLDGAFGVRDSVLYLIASGPGKGGREVWAVDIRTKSMRWQVPCDGEALYVPDSGPHLYNQGPGRSGTLTALDLGTGATVWSRPGDSGIYATTAASGLVDGSVLVTDGAHTISGLDPKTGAALWNTPALSYAADTVFGSADTYYLCDGSKLHAMRPGGDAAPLWSLTVSDQGEAVDAAGYAAAGAFYLLAARTVRAIDARTSKVRWMQSIPDKPGSEVRFAVGEAHCYAESADGGAVVALVR